MGGEQAAQVLSTVKREQVESRGGALTEEQAELIAAPIREKYETEGHPYYGSARLWDDGIVTPADTRDVLALALAAALNAPVAESSWPVFRM
jgi:3-methylcrotonyl-CoA carboxylase beta subunit